MRHAMPREFYLPKSETLAPVDCSGTDAAVYTYETLGVVYAIGFHGKAAKPDFHHRFKDAQRRAEFIAGYLDGRKQRAAAIAEQRAKRTAPHTLKPGDILVCSWGYDQTNIDFYQVTRVPGPSTVEIRQIAANSSEPGSQCPGAVWRITPQCERALDRYEGIDSGLYRKVHLPIAGARDDESSLMLYVMNSSGIMPPSVYYLETIQRGYDDFKLPQAALQAAVRSAWDDKHKTYQERARYHRSGYPPFAKPDAIKLKAKPKKKTGKARTGKRAPKQERVASCERLH